MDIEFFNWDDDTVVKFSPSKRVEWWMESFQANFLMSFTSLTV